MGRLMVVCVVLLAGATVVGQTAAPTPDCAEMKTRLERAETRLSDWPALKRYLEDNLKLAPPARNEQRVVFMGDSITDSWDNPTYGGFFPGKPYVNRTMGFHSPNLLKDGYDIRTIQELLGPPRGGDDDDLYSR